MIRPQGSVRTVYFVHATERQICSAIKRGSDIQFLASQVSLPRSHNFQLSSWFTMQRELRKLVVQMLSLQMQRNLVQGLETMC
jgi:hypothetical protein